MGIALASYAIRWQSSISSTTYPAFTNALDVLEHGHRLGAGGMQVGVGGWTTDFAGKVRDRREALGLYLEGQIRLPQGPADVPRFEREVQQAKEAGADVLRTACLRGRRYETFETLDAFREFQRTSRASLEWAEPVVRKHGVKLAVENHKDWRVPEMLDLLRHLDSVWIGVTLDTGNSMALMEHPMAVVEALAPYTFTTHLKDMAVEEYEDGFLLSEVPLGAGFLDLHRVIAVCRQYNPDVAFNLEMITRDPLQIPCLTDQYWATFEAMPGLELARTLRMVRHHRREEPLPRIAHLDPERQLAVEEENIRSSFAYAHRQLGLA